MTNEGLYPVQMQFDTVVALARGRSRRLGAPLDLAAVWRRRLPAADRLRERGEPAVGARGSTSARDGGARGTRRQPARDAASAPHRKPGAHRRQRHRRSRSGVRRRSASWRGGTPPTFRVLAALRSTSRVWPSRPPWRCSPACSSAWRRRFAACASISPTSLKDGGQGVSSGGARQRFRNGLVVVQMALAVLLLVGAGLMLRSLWSLQRIPIGFDPSNVLTMRVSLPAAGYASPEQVVGFYERLARSRPSAAGCADSRCRRGCCRSARRSATSASWSKATFHRQERARRATGRSSPTATSKRWGSGSCGAARSRPRTPPTLSSSRSSTRRWRGSTLPDGIRSAGA